MLEKAAYRWIQGELMEIGSIESVSSDDLLLVDMHKKLAEKNIQALLEDRPALNMLLWGERGSGKSSLIKMLLTKYADSGLRAVEFRQEYITEIYKLYAVIRSYPELKFMIYFDDISFDNDDILYRRFKSVVEGGLESRPENCIFTATSNRRHLITETAYDTSDIYDRDEVNERISLFARFGLAIGFYPLSRDDYLKIAGFYLDKLNVSRFEDWEREAENFAMNRGGRSGRIANQFAVYMSLTT